MYTLVLYSTCFDFREETIHVVHYDIICGVLVSYNDNCMHALLFEFSPHH